MLFLLVGMPKISTLRTQVLTDTIINNTPEPKSKVETKNNSKNLKKAENHEKTSR